MSNEFIVVDDLSKVVMSPKPPDIGGPIILWENYGYEGWKPTSYPDIKTAVLAKRSYDFALTRVVDFEVCEHGQITRSEGKDG